MKYKLIFLAFISLTFLCFSGCRKHSEDLLTGRWEKINVADIHSPVVVEWEFDNGVVTMFERPKESPGNFTKIDEGFYVLESTPLSTTLRLLNTSNELWNDNWDVSTLDNSLLILHLQVTGGVMFKEFVKIR